MKTGEEITLATYTRSLGRGFLGRRKRKEIRSIYRQTSPATNVLLLHETKLPKAAWFVETQGGINFWNEDAFSAHSGCFKRGTRIVTKWM